MKNIFALVAGFAALFFANGCRSTDIPENALLLDVRTEAEFAERSIPGSILIPHDRIEKDAESKIPDKNTPIVVFCRSGRRSAIAKNKLEALGYTDVTDLGSIDNAAKILHREIK